ncbi:TrkH family potassium uptake protein [Legionella sp. W05-934-2]|uniref:TrkH family potassium uptake protein n=1 Tax=Legionella sp. W05-934-2 TaxID=1198649 RepID=UPI0034632BD1
MQFRTILRILGILLMLFSLTMLTPLIINLFYHEHFWGPFILAAGCTFLTGFVLWLSCRHAHYALKNRDGFLLVALFWSVLCLFAALPFLFALSSSTHALTDAFFESVSGFTTTGASIITHLDGLPHAILFYRQQLQFLGGMGIIVLAVAILPMLGVGGMQLYRAETPGPMKDSKLTPRIAQTAKALWYTYLVLTLLCFLSYWWAGMDWFDALGESFSTVSTGGFSMHDQSFAYYQQDSIELVACLFMFLGGTNFALHFTALKKGHLNHYWQDEEFRVYTFILLGGSILVTLLLLIYGFFDEPHPALIKSLFNVISLATTTGFLSSSIDTWPSLVPYLITFLAIIGGCAGSTSGGIKVMRALLLGKQSMREMKRLIHPNAVINIKFGRHSLADPVLQSMWGFISVFIALFILILLVLIGLGNDLVTSFACTTASLANAGAGIGDIALNFANLSSASKWVLMFAMLAGRLEIFSILVLFMPQFWRK